MHKIELLSPAKDLETGIAAVNYGADAVYIGPQKFGARSAAANSLEDIERLITYAHIYKSKVYATVNTILFDNELEEAEKLIIDLYNIGIDSVIIQDMGILEMNLPPVPIHASTQTDNYDIEKIKFLNNIGFRRIVLAREFSIEEIKEIRKVTQCELEFFIHGSLCVSLSGRCYMSAAFGSRSANRGECAQPCRKSYSFIDADGKKVSYRNYPLSLKDMNQTDNLKDLIDAGIDSLKIEGRLKNIEYVKNIVSHYRKNLDKILEGRDDIAKGSSGKVIFDFMPDPHRTFNRTYTDYFLKGRKSISSPDTPKSLGEEIGRVTEAGNNWFTFSGGKKLTNGDGLAFFNKEKTFIGIRANRIDGNKVFPLTMNGIYKNAVIYRNSDTEFDKILSTSKTARKISVSMELTETEAGFKLAMTDEDNYSASADIDAVKEISKSDKSGSEQVKKQLAKLGSTIFISEDIKILFKENYFIPVSILNELRRRVSESLFENRAADYKRIILEMKKTDIPYPYKQIDFRHNVSNLLAENFYRRHGVETIGKSFETADKTIKGPLMTTKLCLKFENHLCPKQKKTADEFKEPFYLIDGRIKCRIEFDCKNCMMLIYKE